MSEFATTLWSEVLRARDGDAEAIGRFVSRYRAPVYRWFLSRGRQAADAEDLTQEVFRRIVQQEILQRADREKGRLRALLVAIARNVMREEFRNQNAQKRHAGTPVVSLDQFGADVAGPEAAEDRESFDRCWVANLIEAALLAEREQDVEQGKNIMDLLRMRIAEGLGYQELAARTGMTIPDVKRRLHRARERLTARLWNLVRQYASSQAEYDEEIALLKRFLEG